MTFCRPFVSPGILLLVTLLGGMLAWDLDIPATAAEPALVRAASGNLISGTPGPSVVLPVEVTNVQGLGAATVLVGYDPARLTVVACQRNAGLRRRPVQHPLRSQ